MHNKTNYVITRAVPRKMFLKTFQNNVCFSYWIAYGWLNLGQQNAYIVQGFFIQHNKGT